MRILVVGGGGREHALAWKIRQSPRVTELLCAPGNAGMEALGECVPVAADDVDGLVELARRREVDLTVVGPEAPLTMGLVDRFEEAGLRAFGPTAAGARLEGSKAFTKEILVAEGVPTAEARSFTDADAAEAWVREKGAPIVVKADGLAAGKGVSVCGTLDEALEAVDAMLRRGAFGEASASILVEELLEGEEASFIAVTDGETILPFASSQDHKRIRDGDEGPNTGGMGAYSPAPIVTPDVERQIRTDVLEPLLRGLEKRGIRFRGVLYAGLMIHGGRARVLEFNVRFGDPECQALLVRLRSDLVDVLEAAVDGTLDRVELDWDPRPSVCVVMAAEGYPESARKGDPISGLDDGGGDAIVFHAGTKRDDGSVVTAGGRVLGVTALGSGIAEAIAAAYRQVRKISWKGAQYRNDIGARALG